MKKVILVLCLAILSFAAKYSAIRIKNLSEKYYIHAHIDIGGGRWVLYIEPGGESGSVSVPSGERIKCYVIIAPGQDREARIDTILSTQGSPSPFGCRYSEPSTIWEVNVDFLE